MAERGVIFKDDFVSTPGKSWFDMSFDYLFSMNFGELVPSTCMECMGGDVIHAKSDSFVRLAPLVAPTFGKANMFSYHFYVRNYSIWKNWRAFYAEGDQRESWQQSLNGSFVPPEMPHIPVFNALCLPFCKATVSESNGMDFAYYGNGRYDWFDTFLHVEGEDYNKLQCANLRCPALLIYKSGDKFYLSKIINVGDVDFYVPQNNEHYIIYFAPNKYDLSTKPYNIGDYVPSYLRNYDEKYYNVFSNGTLFDFLGVDLSGHYEKQKQWLIDSIDIIRTALSDSTSTDIFDISLEPGVYLHGNETPSGIEYSYPVSLDLEVFVKSHFIFGVTYGHNNQWVTNTVAGSFIIQGADTHDSDIEALSRNPLINWYHGEGFNDYAKITSLPLRAYHSVYIDYFRDENYISVNPCVDFARDGLDLDFTQSIDDLFDYLTLNYKCYEHDPYTTALPQAQRGAPVRFLNDALVRPDDTARTWDAGTKYNQTVQVNFTNRTAGVITSESTLANSGSRYELVVDLSAATIENFRFANATQKLLEKIARSGNRYYEYMRAIYGVFVDDAKIDRPIFLGGDKSPIQISEVLQTSASEVTTDQPLGQMAGRGVSVGNDDYIEYIAPDAGFFVEICCALPRTNYQQGLAPMFHRFDRLDFAIPDYAQLGEQQVPQRELWYSANESDDETPFGYQSRYYDMKYQRDRTSGSFKDSLSFWTWSRIFDEAPVAGKEFLEVRPDYRQFAVTDKNTEHIYVHMWHDIQVNRCLPVFGTPKL